jgi:mannose-6-phosphate isomerase
MNNTCATPPGLTLQTYNTTKNPIVLADIPQFFLSLLTLEEGESFSYTLKEFYSLYLPFSNNIDILIIANQYQMTPGISLNLANASLTIKAVHGKCHLIVAGFGNEFLRDKKLYAPILLQQNEIYKVSKPWGHELWLNNDFGSDLFSFKEVYIKQGFQTSLQYHQRKMECALLYEGTCEVFFGPLLNETTQLAPDSYASKIVNPYSKIFIQPNTIHRMKALSNMYHYEISTPELDDVIRLSDDTNRGHGRICSEHKQI